MEARWAARALGGPFLSEFVSGYLVKWDKSVLPLAREVGEVAGGEFLWYISAAVHI